VLHRLGKNKEALQILQGQGDKDSVRVRQLLSQIVSDLYPNGMQLYKLGDYKAALSNYQDLYANAEDDEEKGDILTNMLACASNFTEGIPIVESLISKQGEERTYEFYFNLCQVQMKQALQ
jgi:tetratricopeptide (TPR) repeat protein